MIPEPEKISKKEKPVRFPRIAKTDSRIRSMAGRIIPSGISIRLPHKLPPVILTVPAPVQGSRRPPAYRWPRRR
jgi:hypothetical protein